MQVDGQEYRVDYEPAESRTGLFGGNSNWRGPVWFPVNYLLIESLQRFNYYFGDDLQVEFPTGSGQRMNLGEVAAELSRRLSHIFLRDANGRRPVFGGAEKFQTDPHFRDHILFYEYFHGDNGAGIGRQPSDRLDGAGGQAAAAERRVGLKMARCYHGGSDVAAGSKTPESLGRGECDLWSGHRGHDYFDTGLLLPGAQTYVVGADFRRGAIDGGRVRVDGRLSGSGNRKHGIRQAGWRH